MKLVGMTRQAHFVPIVHVQTPQTLALQVGRSLVGLTAQQARRLASVLIVQAERISHAEPKADHSVSS